MTMMKALGVLLDAFADLGHDLGVNADEVVAAHPRLARDARRDDDDVGTSDDRIVVPAGEFRVETLDRRGLRDIEALALGNALDDVEEDDVAELLQPGEERERAADLTGADQRDLPACHS